LLVKPIIKQAKQIHWEPLVNILDGHPAVKRIFKSECRIVFKGNKPDIILRGANEDNGDNMRGLKIYFAGLDEMQDIKPIVWTEVIRPALVDTKNSTSLIIGTPKGAGTFFHSLYLQGGEVPNWASFLKTVYDNPFIPLDEIQRTKESLPEKIFRQEFLASWESFDGQIFSDLDKRHLLDDDDLPTKFDQVYIGVDWGDVNPALVVVGRRGAAYFVIDCWENPNPKAAIEQRVHNEKAIELARTHGVNRGYADPSQPGRILTMRKAGVPKLMEGYNRVSEGNGVVNTLLHQDKLFIAKSCKRVFEDMTAYHRESKEGNVTEKVAEGQRDHFCDALRYVLATLEHRNIENIIDSMGANTLIPSVPQDDSLYGNYNSGY
jgi:hypothetical protein